MVNRITSLKSRLSPKVSSLFSSLFSSIDTNFPVMKNLALVAIFLLFIVPRHSYSQVELVRIDGSSSKANSVTIDSGVVNSDGNKLDVNELRLLDFGKEIKAASSGTKISLIGGGTLGASSLTLKDETFAIQNVAGEIRLGVDAVTHLRFKSEELPLYAKATPKEDLDQLFAKIKDNYQTVPGIVDTITESKVVFIYDEDVIEFKLEDVYGLILAQGSEKSEAEVNGVVSLTEGSQLNCLIKSVSANEVKATVGDVADVVLPLSVVSRIEIRSNRLAFLSDLTPTSVKFQQGAVFERQLQKDRNIAGGKLVLRDREKKVSRTFAKGLGTKSGMSVTFPNKGFDRFVTTLGIDASTNGNGVCKVKVNGDGKELFTADLTGVDPPRPLDIEITGIDQIELVIEFGNDFLDLSDHVNWCDARFVKKTE